MMLTSSSRQIGQKIPSVRIDARTLDLPRTQSSASRKRVKPQVLLPPTVTDRLLLRTLVASDVGSRYLSWLSDPEITRYLDVSDKPIGSVDELRCWVDAINASADNVLFGIFLKDTQRHIGNIKFGPIWERHRRGDIGFLIGERDSWGKGFASEAISALTSHVFDHLEIDKITAGCFLDNTGSTKALLKAGFAHEATLPLHGLVDGRRMASLLFGLYRTR